MYTHCPTLFLALSFFSCSVRPGWLQPEDAPRSVLVRKVSLHFGERQLDSGEFPTIDEPTVAGVELDWYRTGAPFGYELGLFRSHDEETLMPAGEFETTSTELSLGIRKTFVFESAARILPYLAAGLSVFDTEKRFASSGMPTVDDDDIDAGLYLRAGVSVRLVGRLYLGVDYRILREELFDYGGFDMDYEQLTATLGIGF